MASIVSNLSPPPLFLQSLPSPPIPTPILHSLRPPRRRPPLSALSCSASDPIPCTTYNGWDDDDNNDLFPLGEQNPFPRFLISAGIDRNHAAIFVLGFVSALAFSRARLPFMVAVVPVSAVVFVAGFAAGAARASGVVGLLDRIWGREGEFAGFDEKRREIGEFLDDLGDKMCDLKNGLEEAIEKNSLDVGSIKSYVDIAETVRSVADDTKKSMEGFVEEGVGKKSSPKASRKRRVDGSDFVQYLSGLVEDCLVGLRPTAKAKDNNASVPVRDNIAVGVGSVNGNNVPNEFAARNSKQMRNNILEISEAQRVKGDVSEKLEPDNRIVNDEFPFERHEAVVDGEESDYRRDGKFSDDMLSYDDELDGPSRTMHSTTKKGSFKKLVFKQIHKGRTLQNDVYDSARNGRRMAESTDFISSESRASSSFERTFETLDKSYFVSHGRKVTVSKNEHVISSKQAKVKSEDRTILDSEKPTCRTEEDIPSSLKTSADEEFNQNVKEGTKLLKLARECLVRRADEERADSMLYESARLLSTAVALKPMSLLAMGRLGNTYLLHGELKLKISRELRTLLLRSDGLLSRKGRGVRLNKLDTQALSRDNVASTLVDVCEECDGLLVEAGRKYRKALAIDGNDVRALYNWGLALSFRAQLIADIGPEAAVDADKVYLAAIDKFSAMMSRSNAYEPDALYRWGMALQHRSHLRPRNSREKIKLLQQAKSLFEDVLCMETDNKLVRESLVSCLSDLGYSEEEW